MNERDALKLRIVAALHTLGVTSARTALSLWAIATKIDDGKSISMRFVARVIEVLCVEGYLETQQCRDEPAVFWLSRGSALSDLRIHLGVRGDSVGEAHAAAETQLPTQDFCENVEIDDDES